MVLSIFKTTYHTYLLIIGKRVDRSSIKFNPCWPLLKSVMPFLRKRQRKVKFLLAVFSYFGIGANIKIANGSFWQKQTFWIIRNSF